MSRLLMIDIGAGTMDILVYDTQTDLHYKAVVKSPVRYLAEKAAAGGPRHLSGVHRAHFVRRARGSKGLCGSDHRACGYSVGPGFGQAGSDRARPGLSRSLLQ